MTTMRLETILDDCVTAIHEQGLSVSECLAQYPAERDELEPLLQLTIRLRGARVVTAPPEFRRVALTRMNNLIAARPRTPEPAVTQPGLGAQLRQRFAELLAGGRRLSLAGVVAVFVALWLFVGGTAVYAAQDSLPGETLYPVKRAAENAQIALTLDRAKDARLYANFASRRLEEAKALASGAGTELGERLIDDYESQIAIALSFLDEQSPLTTTQKAELAELLAARLAEHEAELASLIMQTTRAQPEIEVALLLAEQGREQALFVLGDLPEQPSLPPQITDTATATASPTATATPTVTATATASPTPSRTRSFITPESTLPVLTGKRPLPPPVATLAATIDPDFIPEWESPPEWPPTCPTPPEWPEVWPEDCPPPQELLGHWPELLEQWRDLLEKWPAPPGGWPESPEWWPSRTPGARLTEIAPTVTVIIPTVQIPPTPVTIPTIDLSDPPTPPEIPDLPDLPSPPPEWP